MPPMTQPELKPRRARRPRRPPAPSLEEALLAVLAAIRQLDDANRQLVAAVERLAGEQRQLH